MLLDVATTTWTKNQGLPRFFVVVTVGHSSLSAKPLTKPEGCSRTYRSRWVRPRLRNLQKDAFEMIVSYVSLSLTCLTEYGFLPRTCAHVEENLSANSLSLTSNRSKKRFLHREIEPSPM